MLLTHPNCNEKKWEGDTSYTMRGNTIRVRNLKFARNLNFATSNTLVNFMKKMLVLSKNWHFSVQKALIYYTFNKSHHNSYILLVFSHVANFRYVANFRFLTLHILVNAKSMHTMVGKSQITTLLLFCV